MHNFNIIFWQIKISNLLNFQTLYDDNQKYSWSVGSDYNLFEIENDVEILKFKRP